MPAADTAFLARLVADHPDLVSAVHRLGSDQEAVLRTVARSPYPGGGWMWTGPRTTERLLDSLVKRGLVERIVTTTGRTQYRAIPEVTSTHRAMQAEREALVAAEQRAKQAEREAAHQARYDGSVRLVRTLTDALDALWSDGHAAATRTRRPSPPLVSSSLTWTRRTRCSPRPSPRRFSPKDLGA